MRNWVYNNQNKFEYVCVFASSYYLYSVVRASSLYSVIFSVESPFQFSISLFFLYICISVFCFFVINFWEKLCNWTTEIGHTSSVNFLHLWYCILLWCCIMIFILSYYMTDYIVSINIIAQCVVIFELNVVTWKNIQNIRIIQSMRNIQNIQSIQNV